MTIVLNLCSILFSAVIVVFSSLSVTIASNGGFSVDLFHRDSSQSPLHNSSKTLRERMHHALYRSVSRVNRLQPNAVASSSSNTAAQADLIPDNGEYLLKFSIGNPPHEVFGIFDTGSDLIWMQCKPCDHCYKQISLIFDPKQSSTYKDVSCNSDTCKLVAGFCDDGNKNQLCNYYTGYGDSSFTKGLLGTETITMGSSTTGESVTFPNIIFGCGHNNTGTFDERLSGIIGLGSGTISLASQLASSVGGKFSYCLAPLAANTASKLNFGGNAMVSGPGVISTPIYLRNSFYYLTLEAISVGDKRLPFKAPSSQVSGNQEGNIIIDSGTPMMMLPKEFYQTFEAAVKEAVRLQPLPNPRAYTICYRTKNDNDLPIITLHFKGADLPLKPLNMFVRIEEDVCFSVVQGQGLAVFGNIAHINFLVGYDVVNKVISFKEADCTKQ